MPSVRVVTEDGKSLGIMDTRDAIQEARKLGIDLVEIAPNANPPVCKLIDYGKFLYEQKKRAHEAKKKQVTIQVKEIKLRPGTDEHDFSYRIKHAREWLADGNKVRAAIAFRGREMAHRELGAKILERLTQELEDVADVEVAPKMEGNQLFTIFAPKKGVVESKKAIHTSSQPNADKASKSEPSGAKEEKADQSFKKDKKAKGAGEKPLKDSEEDKVLSPETVSEEEEIF